MTSLSNIPLCLVLVTVEITLQLAATADTSGFHISVGSHRTEHGFLNGKFYLENSQVLFQCEIASVDGDVGFNTKSIGHSLASMGLAPVVTLRNTTWIRTIHFPLESWNSSTGVWKLVASKEDLFTADSGTEDWIAEVSLDGSIEPLSAVTSLLDLTKTSFANTNLGDPLPSSVFASDPSLLGDATNFHLAALPCSPDIAVVGFACNPTKLQGVILGVTTHAFRSDGESTRWYNVTNQLCQESAPDGCADITLVDLILTADHVLLLLTTHGLFLGRLPTTDAPEAIGASPLHQVSWSRVELPSSIAFASFHLSYTAVCYNSYRKSSTDQVAYVAMVNSNEVVYASYPMYTNWTISPSNSPSSKPTDLVHDHHTDSIVILQKKEGKYSVVAFSSDQLFRVGAVNRSRFPAFNEFPSTLRPARGKALCFNPTTHEVFVYGNQVWFSNDGGNDFHQVLALENNETISGCYVSPQGGSVVFTSNLHKLYYGSTGVERLVELIVDPPLPPLQSLAVHITRTGSVIAVGITKISNQWLTQEIQVSSAVQLSETVPNSALAVQFVTEAKAIVYEVIPAREVRGGALTLSPMTAGKQLNQRNVGKAVIIDSLPEIQTPDFSIIVGRAQVFNQFEAETWQTRPALKYDITIHAYYEKTVLMFLKLNSDVHGWHCGDVGKTLEMSGATSILILACHNRTHVQGLPLMSHMLHKTYPAKRWRLYDLRAYPNQADVVNQTLSVNASAGVACLLQEGRFEFGQHHSNMALEAAGGRAKVGAILDESCCRLVNISGSLNGEFDPGEWSLYQTYSDGTEGKLPHVTLTEAPCRHFLTPVTNASRFPVRQLDLRDTFTFSVTATMKGTKAKSSPLMYMRVANPRVFYIRTSNVTDQYGRETLTVRVKNMLHGKGSSSVTFNLPDASLLCPRTSFTLTFQATCPSTKHLHYVYQPQLSQQEFMYGTPLDSKGKPVLIDIPVNYRPPSPLGVSIPTCRNIYNADPSKPRPRDIYQISKDTGIYKQCLGKANRSECGCTDAMKMSSLEGHTDCRQRAYRLVHPGKLSTRFQILEAGKEPTELVEPYVITVNEINGRQDYNVEDESTPSLDEMKENLTEQIGNTGRLINPATVRLILTGAGLYHFRTSVIRGFSYCNLADEVQVYVDKAPLPNPTQMIVITVVSVVIGGVLFSVYLYYLHSHHRPRIRKTGSQCMDPQEQRELK